MMGVSIFWVAQLLGGGAEDEASVVVNDTKLQEWMQLAKKELDRNLGGQSGFHEQGGRVFTVHLNCREVIKSKRIPSKHVGPGGGVHKTSEWIPKENGIWVTAWIIDHRRSFEGKSEAYIAAVNERFVSKKISWGKNQHSFGGFLSHPTSDHKIVAINGAFGIGLGLKERKAIEGFLKSLSKSVGEGRFEKDFFEGF